jgi:hypothetical protein
MVEMGDTCSTEGRKYTYNISAVNTEQIACVSLDIQKDNIDIDHKEIG